MDKAASQSDLLHMNKSVFARSDCLFTEFMIVIRRDHKRAKINLVNEKDLHKNEIGKELNKQKYLLLSTFTDEN